MERKICLEKILKRWKKKAQSKSHKGELHTEVRWQGEAHSKASTKREREREREVERKP